MVQPRLLIDSNHMNLPRRPKQCRVSRACTCYTYQKHLRASLVLALHEGRALAKYERAEFVGIMLVRGESIIIQDGGDSSPDPREEFPHRTCHILNPEHAGYRHRHVGHPGSLCTDNDSCCSRRPIREGPHSAESRRDHSTGLGLVREARKRGQSVESGIFCARLNRT